MARLRGVSASGGGSSVIANAGSDQVQRNLSTVTLDGSGSSGYSSLAWTLLRHEPDGTTTDRTAFLSSTTAVGPTFMPDGPGYTYTATLTLDGTVSDSVAITITKKILVDLSSPTESNTGQKGGNTSLGTNNRIEIAAVHGRPDGGLDGYTATVQLLDKPPNAVGISATMTCSTPDPAAALGANGGLHLYVGHAATPTTNSGYLSGWQWQNTNTRYRALSGVSRVGNIPTGTTVIDTQANAGTLICNMIIYFDNSGDHLRATARVWGEDGSTNGLSAGNQTANLTVGGQVHIGFACDQTGATPADVLDMQDVTFEYEWLI